MNLQLRARAGTYHAGHKSAIDHHPAGACVTAPAARPLREVRCACGKLLRYVRSVPEAGGACAHGACPRCAARLRAGFAA